MKAPPAPRPSESELQAAFNREAPHRAHWPQNYFTAMQDPLIAALVRTLAAHPHMPPEPVTTRHPMRRRGPGPKPAQMRLDGKMLAAGEKPEPDETP